ncbi:MAG: GNAT family N-acetyltransferase [Planctomycetota bacterium]|jgi:ribosomal protein S18 acetylase RimI-like enzyme
MTHRPDPGYQIRPASPADVDAIVGLERSHMKAEAEKRYPGRWDEEETRDALMGNLEDARVLIWESRVVGAYTWWIEPPATAVLHSVQVAPGHRNLGLGTQLIRDFEKEARSRGMKTAGLTVFKTNRAIGLYRRLGYEVTGEDGPHAVEMRKNLMDLR